jgi:hypothetical protein
MILTLLIAAAVATNSSKPAPKPDARTVPTGGTATAMKALESAYQDKNPDGLDALYTADYEYVVDRSSKSDPSFRGFTREDELKSARNLFRGVGADGTAMPPAQSIDVTMAGLSENTDPEHPDSTAVYRLVVCREFALNMKMQNGDAVKTTPSLHVFQLVRGDVAVLADGQTADPKRWYIRRWVDDANGLANALALTKGDCTPQPVPVTEIVPGLRLVIQPLGNPACPTIDLACVIPATGAATVEVFDVTGRRVHRQTIQVTQPGPQKIQAGAGATIKPGAYFVRVTQGSAIASQKVLVAK